VVDQEVSKLISNAHQEAFDILSENRDVLDSLVRALFEKETLDRAEVAEVFQPLRLRPKRPAWTGSESRVPSSIPPVMPPPPAIGQNGHRSNGQGGPGQLPPAPGEHPAGGAPVPPGHTPVPPSLPQGQGSGVEGPTGQPPVGPGGPGGQPGAGGPQGPGVTGGHADPRPGSQNWPPAGPDFR
jgi:cell division protease FtsH